MTLTEECDNSDPNNCPKGKLGFVDPVTQKGTYDFTMIINENVWIITPTFYYDYILATKKWGRVSVGGAFGLVFLSARQRFEFSAVRTDVPLDTGEVTDPYKSRRMEAVADSTAVNDVGPVFRLYVGFKRRLVKNMFSEIRIGGNYGFVNLTRDVDGAGRAMLGDTLVASFPAEALGFKDHEINRFDLVGFFIQAGLVF